VYETSYVGQGMRAITQDIFLGRGAHSPLIDILNHIGLRYDENAPLEAIDEMIGLVGPDSNYDTLARGAAVGPLNRARRKVREGQLGYWSRQDEVYRFANSAEGGETAVRTKSARPLPQGSL
jgi:hypothetical protein